MIRMYDMAFYFLFSISFFFWLFGFFSLCLWFGPTCDRKKFEGKSQSMQQIFILHDVPAKWQMATFFGDPTK